MFSTLVSVVTKHSFVKSMISWTMMVLSSSKSPVSVLIGNTRISSGMSDFLSKFRYFVMLDSHLMLTGVFS